MAAQAAKISSLVGPLRHHMNIFRKECQTDLLTFLCIIPVSYTHLRIPCFYVGIFLQDYFRGQRHRLLDDNIDGELIPNRLIHALQINASLVDFVDKDNGGNCLLYTSRCV